MSTDSP